ncbi:MAG: hypothetical protein IT236_09055 [Bacteroidia bacterium]|nr:hypothetical protein [Bacteroidia bacterium]
MKKSNLFILAGLIASSTLLAQDHLYKKDNSHIQVKIIEVGSSQIKYKLYNNQNGPLYTENKSNVSLIIYESGVHEVINSASEPEPAAIESTDNSNSPTMSRADSMAYFKYPNSISINFLNFLNNEVGLIYQADFYKSNFSIIVPVAFGVEKPNITQSTYFNSTNNGTTVELNTKNFELGFGINYYPSLKTNVNYFIGPAFRFMQYSGTGVLNYQVPYIGANGYTFYNNQSVRKSLSINRYCMSITNGVVIRTRSRLNATIFGSMGFKNDITTTELINPTTNAVVKPIRMPLSFYFWCGFNVGFCF